MVTSWKTKLVVALLTTVIAVPAFTYAAEQVNAYQRLRVARLIVTNYIQNSEGRVMIKDLLTVTGNALFKNDVTMRDNLAVGGTIGVMNVDFADADITTLDTTTLTGGSVYYNLVDTKLYMWTGTAWVDLSQTSTLGDTIESSEVTDDTIAAADIATDAVTTTEILDGTVAAADIATDGVATAEILDSTVASADIAADTIAAGDIATDAVTTTEILDGTVAAADIANVGRYISFPLRSFIECDTDAGADINYSSGADAFPDFVNSATDGTGFVISFDDTGGSLDADTEICNNFTVPSDYASDGSFVVRVLKDGNTTNVEKINCAVSVNGGTLQTDGNVNITAAATASYTCTPTISSLATNDSVGFYLSVSSSAMDDTVNMASVAFVYNATQ